MSRFEGQVAIVTGASDGIGLATSQLLAQEGAGVLMVARGAERLQAAADALKAQGLCAVAIAGDAGDPATAAIAVERAMVEWGRVDILVNNVGGSTVVGDLRTAPLEQFGFDDWQRLVSFNLDPVFLFCHAVLPLMKKACSGKIVNVSSIAARGLGTSSAGYCAAKAGIVAITKKLSLEAGPFNVNVNAVAPALTVTGRLQFFVDNMTPQQHKDYVESIALRRLGTAQDQANVICFLASEAAGFMTGETLQVNGGQY